MTDHTWSLSQPTDGFYVPQFDWENGPIAQDLTLISKPFWPNASNAILHNITLEFSYLMDKPLYFAGMSRHILSEYFRP